MATGAKKRRPKRKPAPRRRPWVQLDLFPAPSVRE
jgi:hypothetical protein